MLPLHHSSELPILSPSIFRVILCMEVQQRRKLHPFKFGLPLQQRQAASLDRTLFSSTIKCTLDNVGSPTLEAFKRQLDSPLSGML